MNDRLPASASCVTNAVLTRGGRILEGWRDGAVYYETYRYPGALNYQSTIRCNGRPEWASTDTESRS